MTNYTFQSLLCFILLISINTFSQNSENLRSLPSEKAKRNQVGFDVSIGPSILYHKKTRLSYALNLNYSRLSKSKRWVYEFGIRYTQLNYENYKSFKDNKDTLRKSTGYISFFDTPINFKRIMRINQKTSFVLNLGVFYTTYIRQQAKNKYYLSADNSFIMKNKKVIHNFNYFKMGIDIGLGFNRKIKSDGELYFLVHWNNRFELDIFGNGYGFVNLSVGYRKSF